MSRSGYSDDFNGWASICWRGAVKAAINGRRGQKFLRDLLGALDAMPNKRLITDELVAGGDYCALGVLGAAKGIPMGNLNPDDSEKVAEAFSIAPALAREVVYMNDEFEIFTHAETPEQRWGRMRMWVVARIKPLAP